MISIFSLQNCWDTSRRFYNLVLFSTFFLILKDVKDVKDILKDTKDINNDY